MDATNSKSPSNLEPEVPGPYTPIQSPAQRLDLANTKLRMALDEANTRLLHSRICLQSETQSRQTIQRGLDILQQRYSELGKNFESTYEECDRELIRLKEDLRIAEELIQSQKQLIDIYQQQQQQQQQQPTSHLIQGGPLLPQYNDHSQYSSYQPPGNHEFVIDPAGHRPLGDFDNGIGLSVGGCCDMEPVMSTTAAGFENQTPHTSIQSVLHPISAERDIPGPGHTMNRETKRGQEDEGLKPNKKRKMK